MFGSTDLKCLDQRGRIKILLDIKEYNRGIILIHLNIVRWERYISSMYSL